MEWNDLNIDFDEVEKGVLKIGCYAKERKGGKSDYRELGRSNIAFEDLKSAPLQTYRSFIISYNIIVGSITIKFNHDCSRATTVTPKPTEKS
jgi:hypothetical protein